MACGGDHERHPHPRMGRSGTPTGGNLAEPPAITPSDFFAKPSGLPPAKPEEHLGYRLRGFPNGRLFGIRICRMEELMDDRI